jgi:ribonuclease Y
VEMLNNPAIAITGFVLGILLYWVWRTIKKNSSAVENVKKQAEEIISNAILVNQRETLRQREILENEISQAKNELLDLEKRLHCKEQNLNYRIQQLEKREEHLQTLEEKIKKEEKRLQEKIVDLELTLKAELKNLESISSLTKEKATEMLLCRIEQETQKESAQIIEKMMQKAKAEVNFKAHEILTTAMQRCAVEYTANSVVSIVDIPNEHMKGRIIGKEGRNIRSFEKVTGVDVIVDDTPGVVIVSSFNPIRREIARRSLEKLILDGRIHPARIEELVEETSQEMDKVILETGKQACYDLNIMDVDQKEIVLIGKLNFLTMAGQNLLKHTMEIAYLSCSMASELQLNLELTKRCALLHDIGRAADHTLEGSHSAIGADIAKRCQESAEVVNAIAAHHEEVEANSPYAILIQIAHKISMERPGAVKEHWDRYLKRLERLETIALSFKGIEKAYAIQTGREVRCLVNTSEIDDVKAVHLARNIARKINEEFPFPGEIKVSVLREIRIIEYAR